MDEERAVDHMDTAGGLKKKLKTAFLWALPVIIASLYMFSSFFYTVNGVSVSLDAVPFALPEKINGMPTDGLVCWRQRESEFFGLVEYLVRAKESEFKEFVDKIHGEDSFESSFRRNPTPYCASEMFPEMGAKFRIILQASDRHERDWITLYYSREDEVVYIRSSIQQRKKVAE